MSIDFGIDQSKYNRQLEGGKKWKEAGGKGSFCYPTGFGKTMAGMIVAEPFLDKNWEKDYRVDIAVPSAEIKRRWELVIKEPYRDRITVRTADEILTQGLIITTQLLIVDEVDVFLSDERFKILNGTYVQFKYILSLTGSWEDRQGREKKLETICPLVDRITEKEALENGWISQFIEYNIGIDFDNSKTYRTVHITHDDGTAEDVPMNREEYYEYVSKEIQRFNSKFGKHGMKYANAVLSGFKGENKDGQYVEIPGIAYARQLASQNGWTADLDLSDPYDKNINDQWSPNVIIGYAKNLFHFIRLRKKMLYDAPEKLALGKQILDKFPQLKTISFAESTEFADMFCEYVNKGLEKPVCTVYHSKIQSRPLIDPTTGEYYVYKSGEKKGKKKVFGAKLLKEFAINAITNGTVKTISTAKALDRGFNVQDISLAIVHSRNSSFQQHLQRSGRTKRLNPFKPDEIVLIVNLYIRFTKEEEWLKEAQSRNSNTVYWVNSVEQINYTPKERFEFNMDLFE